MNARIRLSVAVALLIACALSPAYAGDPPAHSAAMLKAAYLVAQKDDFQKGVGAPYKKNMRVDGKFKIPVPMPAPDGGVSTVIAGDPYSCPRDAMIEFGKGCSYQEVNGEAVNEPDDWDCIDSRQPPGLNLANSTLAPIQADLADTLSSAKNGPPRGVACNYNHFTSNTIGAAVTTAQTAGDLTLAWAYEITDSIRDHGATIDGACTKNFFDRYYKRVANALHYYQDIASEHHAEGNLKCNESEANPVFSMPGNVFSYARIARCITWVDYTVTNSIALTPSYWCDDEVTTGTREYKSLSANMTKAYSLCKLGLPFSCMGLERTLRHHCTLDTPKSVLCDGPGGDHKGAVDNHQYCEGERFNDGGSQDFVTPAAAVSATYLAEAMYKWSSLCREPDDPCVPDDCNTWCKNSAIGKNVAGYCVNDSPDPECVLHQCRCVSDDKCGGASQPCCKGGDCDGSLECGASTGTCVPKGEGTCSPKVLISPEFSRLSCGESQNYTVKLEPPDSPLPNLSYVYSNSASAGHLSAPGATLQDNFETTSPKATYTVKDGDPEGTDTIEVEVYSTDDAMKKRKVGKASATVKVGKTCQSSAGYVGGPGYNSNCTVQLSGPKTVAPGQMVDVTAQTSCGGAVVYMSYATKGALDGGPLTEGSGGGGGLYDYCYYGVPEPIVAGGAGVVLPDNEPHTVHFLINPDLTCSVCTKEVLDGIPCSTSPANHLNIVGPGIVMYGAGGTHGWSAVKFFEIQVPTK